MSAGELAGFKRGTHKNDFEVVKQKAKYNDINLSNLSMVLYAIYMELNVSDIKDCSFKLLDILIQNNPNFGNKGKLGNIAIKNLKDIYDKVMLENNQLNEIIPDTNSNTNNTNSNNGQQLAINQDLIEKTLKIIKALYKRLHLKQISIKVFQFHQQNGTVPQKLNIHHFPPPFLPHCIIFVDIHNGLVKECQTKMMNACVERLNEQISKIRDNITSNKNKIKDMTVDIDEKLSQISDDVENSLKPSLEKALDKAKRITIREFVVKTNDNDENVSIDEDWFVFETNNNNNNNNSRTHHSDSRQNEIRSRNSSNVSRPHNFSHQSRSRNSSFSRNNDNRSRSNYWNNDNSNNNNDRYKHNHRQQRTDNRNSNNYGHQSRNNYNNSNWRNFDRNSSSNRNQRNYASFNRSSSKNRHTSRNHSRSRNNNQ